jgi:hypothetical protein
MSFCKVGLPELLKMPPPSPLPVPLNAALNVIVSLVNVTVEVPESL